MTQYTFSITLLNTSGESGVLAPWQNGTLTLDDSAAPTVTGVLTLPGDLQEPIPFTGSILNGDIQATTFTAKGEGAKGWVELSLAYGSDQLVYTGTYIGGLANLLGSGQEWLYYVVQGTSPQGPPLAEEAGAE